MKQILIILFSLGFLTNTTAQNSDFIHTSGKYILGPCDDTLLFRGVNYAPYNYGYSINDIKLDQIALSGANTVRLVWYQYEVNTSIYSNYTALDSAISKCIQQNMIVILELHDYTCQNNASNLTQSTLFWTNPEIVAILLKYKQSIIVNIANEALYVNWTGNPTNSLATYKTTYQNIISSLRNVTDFDFPIMIDAPDCGQTSDVFITNNLADDLINFDPIHNLIFSAHAYWYGYANNDSLQMASKINNVLSANFPFVLGEIANLQDDATTCQYNLNYEALLNHCETQGVSWLAWSWDHDVCSQRQITSNGNFNSLTAYGNDIINNPRYGLANRVPKSRYLENKACGNVKLQELSKEEKNLVFPIPTEGIVSIQTSEKGLVNYEIFDLKGEVLLSANLNEAKQIDISFFERGMYFIKFNTASQLYKVIKQ